MRFKSRYVGVEFEAFNPLWRKRLQLRYGSLKLTYFRDIDISVDIQRNPQSILKFVKWITLLYDYCLKVCNKFKISDFS